MKSSPPLHLVFVDGTQAGLHVIHRALDRGFNVSFVRGMGINYYQVDGYFRSITSRLLHYIEIADSFSVEAIVLALDEIASLTPVDAVFGQYDPMMPALARACEVSGYDFPSNAAVLSACNKSKTRLLVGERGLRSVKHRVVHDLQEAREAADEIGFPVVVKPVLGMDSVLSARVDDFQALESALGAIISARDEASTQASVACLLRDGVQVEGYLSGQLVSAEIGVRDGVWWRFMLSGRSRARSNDCIEIGAFMPADVDAATAESAYSYAEECCQALGLHRGIFHVEMILTSDGPALVEINPRAMGGAMASMYEQMTGRNFADHVLDLQLGTEVDTPPCIPGMAVAARRLLPSVDSKIQNAIPRAVLQSDRFVTFEDYMPDVGSSVSALQLLGRFTVTAGSVDDAIQLANRCLIEIESLIKVPLVWPEDI